MLIQIKKGDQEMYIDLNVNTLTEDEKMELLNSMPDDHPFCYEILKSL
jgi:hypothetical protein